MISKILEEQCWCSFCKQLEGHQHLDSCVQHGGHTCMVAGDCREPPGRRAAEAIQTYWISVEDELPPPHENVWCYNRDGRHFEGRICYGLHKPFFTYPHGDGNASNTAPSWIDVTHWMPLPLKPST